MINAACNLNVQYIATKTINLDRFKGSVDDLYLPVDKMFSPENENKFKFLVKNKKKNNNCKLKIVYL